MFDICPGWCWTEPKLGMCIFHTYTHERIKMNARIVRINTFQGISRSKIIIQLDQLTLRPKTSLKFLKAQHSWAAWYNQSIKITWHCWRLSMWPMVMTAHCYITTVVLIVHFILGIHQLESGIHEHARSTTSEDKDARFPDCDWNLTPFATVKTTLVGLVQRNTFHLV